METAESAAPREASGTSNEAAGANFAVTFFEFGINGRDAQSLTDRARPVCSLRMRPSTAALVSLASLLCCSPGFSPGLGAAEPAKPKKAAATKKTPPPAPAIPADTPWGDWVEKDFPFFSTVLDAREAGNGLPKDNLTPRGLVLNLGQNLWACFDTDLLRVACVWQGEPGKVPVTPEALAPGSYHIAGQKTKDGQDFLPKPTGAVWLANGIYPGWHLAEKPRLADPREPSASPEEVGRGSLAGASFEGVFYQKPEAGAAGHWVLRYTVGKTRIVESWNAAPMHSEGRPMAIRLERTLQVEAHEGPLAVALGQTSPGTKVEARYWQVSPGVVDKSAPLEIRQEGKVAFATLAPSAKPVALRVTLTTPQTAAAGGAPETALSQAARWPQLLESQGVLSDKAEAYVLDEIPLPVPNPWKRNVRLADIAFLNDQGDAAAVAFDGDVWLLSGLKGDLRKVTWKRFASGLHEPMSIVHRQDGLFVFDRSGVWKLVDRDGDKEVDEYHMFCNLFAQTAETREFPNSMKAGPDGSLYLSKGGQEGTTYGKHNGTVIKVAPDGKSFAVIGHGLRQPFIGVNPENGLVTASDQQGNYVPSTPLQIIEKNQFYGHLPVIAPEEKYPEPIAEPMVWLPHPVNPSGATQTWLLGAQMGPVNGELIHVGYNRPELFRVLMNPRFKRPQAAVMSFSRDFDFGPLNAQVNPADGQLYVIGFQVWGTTAKKLSGLVRLRYTDKPRVLLKEVTPMDKGLLLRFNAPLAAKLATDPASYSAERWNYKRTHDYGSPHLKLDGSTGQEWLTPSSAYLSQDGMSVFVGLPDMKAGVHQMRIGWGLESADGLKAANTAYFTAWELAAFDPVKEGFGSISVDLTPRQASSVALAKPTVEEGAKLYQMIGCMACHSTDGSTVGKVGPSWKGIYGTERVLGKGGKSAVADEAYLRESIVNPSAKVVKGFEKFDTGMPIYAGILNDSQIESLILYIKSLK